MKKINLTLVLGTKITDMRFYDPDTIHIRESIFNSHASGIFSMYVSHNVLCSQKWLHTPVIPVAGKQRQEAC